VNAITRNRLRARKRRLARRLDEDNFANVAIHEPTLRISGAHRRHGPRQYCSAGIKLNFLAAMASVAVFRRARRSLRSIARYAEGVQQQSPNIGALSA
jgi:hypothetical protein